MKNLMSAENYQSYLERIRYCQSLSVLQEITSQILLPTGFGVNQVDGVDVGLDYYEIATCLKDTDQAFFQKHIELLVFAHQQVTKIETGQVPEKPEPVPGWQMFT